MNARFALSHTSAPHGPLLEELSNPLDPLFVLWPQNYLRAYIGAIYLTFHNRAFMDKVVNEVYEIAERGFVQYTGNSFSYLG